MGSASTGVLVVSRRHERYAVLQGRVVAVRLARIPSLGVVGISIAASVVLSVGSVDGFAVVG